MSFYNEYLKIKQRSFEVLLTSFKEEDVKLVLQKDQLNELDLLVLLSPAAEACLEEIAQKAHRLTVKHFGKSILLFSPIYIADYCVNHCTYCSFSIMNNFARKKLTLQEIEEEAKIISRSGLRHILILTGESKLHAPVSYIKQAVEILKIYFSSISIEINPLDIAEYRELIEAGVDGLTVYQEVYNDEAYRTYHLKGPKRDFRYRLDTPERACIAGMRFINIGALLGLDNWRTEVFFSGLHAQYLLKKYPYTDISLSLPRLRPHFGHQTLQHSVDDKHFVQSILALRLFAPHAGITLSTRESATLRDQLIPLGITKMSAGSSTVVGGYSQVNQGRDQFEISDNRSIADICQMLHHKGYQPIFKDWQHF